MRYVVVELEAQPETVADGNIVAVHGPWWDDGLAHDWARRQAEENKDSTFHVEMLMEPE